jgi:hypothetical protein
MKLGDTLAEIGKQYGIPTEQLLKTNPHITDANQTYAGSLIRLKSTISSTSIANNAYTSNVINPEKSSTPSFAMMAAPQLQEPKPTTPGFGSAQHIVEEEGEEAPHRSKKEKSASMPPPFDQWADSIYAAAEKYQVEASLIAAVIWCESGGNNIINGYGHGLMQIDRRRHNDWLQKHDQGMDATSNIDYGTSMLRRYLDQFSQQRKLALVAYKVGIETLLASQNNNQKQLPENNYALDVLAQQEYFKKFFEDEI